MSYSLQDLVILQRDYDKAIIAWSEAKANAKELKAAADKLAQRIFSFNRELNQPNLYDGKAEGEV